MTEYVNQIINNLINEEYSSVFFQKIILINNFNCFYDKSIYRAWKQFCSNVQSNDSSSKNYLLLNAKKIYGGFKQLKPYMKKSERKEIKNRLRSNIDQQFNNLFFNIINPQNNRKNAILSLISKCLERKLEDVTKIYVKLKDRYKFQDMKTLFFTYICYLNYEESKVFRVTSKEFFNFLTSCGLLTLEERDEIRAELSNQMQIKKTVDKSLEEILKMDQFTQEDKNRIKTFISIVHEALSNISQNKLKFWGNLEMICFGSFINGFSLKRSDIDCSILTNNYIDERQLLYHLNSTLESLKSNGFQMNLLNNKIIKIPILKINCELGDMDMAVNNVLGVANSKLLKVYSKITPKCSELGKLVKIWGKNHGLIGPSAMSSYGMLLLVIYFLQLKKIVPSIQAIAKEKRKKSDLKPAILKIKRKVKNNEIEEFETIIEFESNLLEINK